MVLIGNYQVATISRYKFRMPTSTSWFSSTTDVILKVFPAFWTHFVFFLGVFILQTSSTYGFFPHCMPPKTVEKPMKKTKAKENQQKNQRKPMTNKNNDKTSQNTWMTIWNSEEKGRTKKNTENHKKIMNKGKNTYWIWRRILNSKKKVLENWLAF